MRTLFTAKPYPPYDEKLYSTLSVQHDMEKSSGVQDALQGSVQVEKTATEARIQEAGRGARTDTRLDMLDDILTELGQYTAEVALQKMDESDAFKLAGPDAVWPQLTSEEALNLFEIEVKAGSSGKPKAQSDREIWVTSLPLLEKLIDRIGQARVMNQEWAAKPWIAILIEHLKRFDDPADYESFLPVPEQAQQQSDEPDEKEKAEVELDKSRALSERADAIAKVPGLFDEQQAMALLLFGGQPQEQAEPEPDGEQPPPPPDPTLQ
jgi:hypothetical protein